MEYSIHQDRPQKEGKLQLTVQWLCVMIVAFVIPEDIDEEQPEVCCVAKQ
jgi:hypothetical protein